MKIRPVEATFFHASGAPDAGTDRQTDMTKLIVTSRYFASPPKN